MDKHRLCWHRQIFLPATAAENVSEMQNINSNLFIRCQPQIKRELLSIAEDIKQRRHKKTNLMTEKCHAATAQVGL